MKKFFALALICALVLALVPSVALAVEHTVNSETDLVNAISSASSGDTIKLGSSFSVSARIDVKNQLTLDLNGNTLTSSENGSYGAIYVGTAGNLAIQDGLGGGAITAPGIAIGNYGKVSISGGTITGNPALYNFYYNDSTYGQAEITGGTVKSSGSDSIWNCGILTISGNANVEDTIDSTNTLTISGGTVENLLLKTPDYRQTAPVNSITGGTVTGTITTDNDGARVYPSHVAPTGFISGGSFDNQPDDAFPGIRCASFLRRRGTDVRDFGSCGF